MNKTFSRPSSAGFAILALAVGTAAYAMNPVADEKIAVAKASVDRAEQSGAPQAAPVEMAAARDKLAKAEKANLDHDRKPAAMWAEQADIDARVAEAMAQLQISKNAAAQFDASMQALKQESLRSTPATPPTP